MQGNRMPVVDREVAVQPHNVELVLTEDGRGRLALILPPLEEIRKIQALSSRNISLQETAAKIQASIADDFREQFQKLLLKRERFGRSPTFLTHLANLAELSGDLEEEFAILHEGESGDAQEFFRHRKAVNQISRGLHSEAEGAFLGLDLDSDVGANLRLAYLQVLRQHFSRAADFVDKAIRIDPIDFGARMFQGALALASGDSRSAIHSFRVASEERETSALFANMAIAYIRIGRVDKAFSALRRAIAIEPFNENAVILLADLAFAEKKPKLALSSLRGFVEFEQKNHGIWARLARAYLEVGYKKEALEALRREASVVESSAVFNNLGVVWTRLNDSKKAAEYFAFAMRKARADERRDYFLAGRNYLSALAELNRLQELVSAARELVQADHDSFAARDPVLSDIYSFLVFSVIRAGNVKEANKLALAMLSDLPDAHPKLRIWLMAGIIGSWAYREETRERALALAQEALGLVDLVDRSDSTVFMLKNNVAFLYLESSKLDEAAKLLSEIAKHIHSEPYATATFGLLQLRKRNLPRAIALYEEAIKLASSVRDKNRISQKMNLELGKAFFSKDPVVARKYLLKASRLEDGVEALQSDASKLLSAISKKPIRRD